jgi:hypothetical protein
MLMRYKSEWLYAYAKYLTLGANLTITVCALLGAVVFGGGLAVYQIQPGGTLVGWQIAALAFIGACLGGLAGFSSTWLWRVLAHMVLCFAQIEENTRVRHANREPTGNVTVPYPRY